MNDKFLRMAATILTVWMSIVIQVDCLPAKDIIVEADGKLSSIKSALQIAKDGDRIVVKAGHYAEGNIVIDKSVELVGEDYPEIDGMNQHEVITVTAGNVTIEGFVIKNAGVSFIEDNAGIRLEEVQNCRIRENILKNNFFAIYLSKVKDCLVEENVVSGNAERESTSGNGIHLWYCKDVRIRNNRIDGHRDGIYFEFVQASTIDGNLSRKNLRYGLHFMFSDSCSYINNIFRDNGAGVAVMYTHQVVMARNRFENNWGAAAFGLLLKEITDGEIYENVFYCNSTGIYSEASNRNRIFENEFNRNGKAIKLMANSMNNIFTKNNFMQNSFDVATNSRQNFNRFEENYWSRYAGHDLDANGIGDVPYHPVSLFSLMVEKNPPALILLRSFFIRLLDIAEKTIPLLTPETLVDRKPRMERIK